MQLISKAHLKFYILQELLPEDSKWNVGVQIFSLNPDGIWFVPLPSLPYYEQAIVISVYALAT